MISSPQSGGLARLTVYSLAALAVGLAVGIAFLRDGHPATASVLGISESVIRAWTNGFRLLVAPLVASQLYLALAGGKTPKGALGRLGLVTPFVFVALLVLIALLSVGVVSWLLRLPLLRDLSLPSVTAVEATTSAGSGGGAAWVDDFLPPNLVAAASTDNILPVMLFAIVFALAARRLAPALQESLERGITAVNGATFILVDWLLRLTPIVVLALGLVSASRSGLRVGGALLAFTGVEMVALVLAILALYPVTAMGGRVSPARLARSLVPAQITAATSRSSLATVPALLAASETHFDIPKATASYVVPLAGAVLKLSRAVSSPTKLLFLAWVLGVPLSLERIVVFTVTIILLSPSTVGVPRVTSGTRSLPAYVAAGIPPEYVVLLGTTTAVTDIFMTVLNTTGYMSANVLVGRFATRGATERSAAPAIAVRASDAERP